MQSLLADEFVTRGVETLKLQLPASQSCEENTIRSRSLGTYERPFDG